jgi:murein DD-endopeptidase MepM/ murein hydrolase activator NlpD
MSEIDRFGYEPTIRVPFASGSTITQDFGANPPDYAKFRLDGHEGIDCIPKDRADKAVLAVQDGIVTKDQDSPNPTAAYGNYLVILDPGEQQQWVYAHLAVNFAEVDSLVKRGDPLGLMGATGNATGAHLHLGTRLTDEHGRPLNLDNGYRGFLDPKPFLKEMQEIEDAVMATAESVEWMPVNNESALWQYAQRIGLEDQQTDEVKFMYHGESYLAQVFNRGIAYVKMGDWGNIYHIPK